MCIPEWTDKFSLLVEAFRGVCAASSLPCWCCGDADEELETELAFPRTNGEHGKRRRQKSASMAKSYSLPSVGCSN
jgi:hypothetical protein